MSEPRCGTIIGLSAFVIRLRNPKQYYVRKFSVIIKFLISVRDNWISGLRILTKLSKLFLRNKLKIDAIR